MLYLTTQIEIGNFGQKYFKMIVQKVQIRWMITNQMLIQRVFATNQINSATTNQTNFVKIVQKYSVMIVQKCSVRIAIQKSLKKPGQRYLLIALQTFGPTTPTLAVLLDLFGLSSGTRA